LAFSFFFSCDPFAGLSIMAASLEVLHDYMHRVASSLIEFAR
jgi:hypothetical protein